MVKMGDPDPAGPVARFGFSNPDRPRLGVEVLGLTELTSRISDRMREVVHRTDFHQIFLITAGQAVTMVDFIDHPCPPGTLVHVSPGRVVRLPQPVDPSVEPSALMVLFTPDFPPRLTAARTLLAPFGPAVWHLEPESRSEIARAVADLGDEYARAVREPDGPVTIDVLRHLLAALLLRIVRETEPQDGLPGLHGRDDEIFLRFRRELERSFATTRGVAHYAARLGYSPRILNRASMAATGSNAKAVIDARVVLEAKRLLAHSDLPVAAIGYRLGFAEPTNFGKFFARRAGVSPGAFRAATAL
jgi:AraC-like DNA-binding protein